MAEEPGPRKGAKVSRADAVPNRRRGGELRVLLSPSSVGSTSGFMGSLTLEPGEFVSEHYHPYSEEFLYVVRGTATVRLDGTPVTVAPDEAVFIARTVRHRVENNGDEPVHAVFQLGPLAPRPDLGHVDTEELPAPDEAPMRSVGSS